LMPLWTLLFNRYQLREIPSLKFIWFMTIMGLVPWEKRFYRKDKSESGLLNAMLGAILAPAAAIFIQGAALWGMLSRLVGRGVSWKNRRV
jgi:hypothetical protein